MKILSAEALAKAGHLCSYISYIIIPIYKFIPMLRILLQMMIDNILFMCYMCVRQFSINGGSGCWMLLWKSMSGFSNWPTNCWSGCGSRGSGPRSSTSSTSGARRSRRNRLHSRPHAALFPCTWVQGGFSSVFLAPKPTC